MINHLLQRNSAAYKGSMGALKKTTFCVLLACASLVRAEPVLDCWIGNAGNLTTTHFIRCIAERTPLEGGVQAVSSGVEAILDLIHQQLHNGQVAEADQTLRTNAALLRPGDYHSVVLYSYPAEWSWENSLPQKLAQSALCGGTSCQTLFFRRK